MEKISLAGLNVQAPWARLLLKGEKTIETRVYPLSKKYVGQDLWLIETPGLTRGSKAMVIGIISFFDSFPYHSKFDFSGDFDRHLVPNDHPLFGYQDTKPKFGWRVSNVVPIQPFEPKVRRGIIYTRPFSGCASPPVEARL